MKSKYNLNLKIFEYGIVLSSIARWHGIVALKAELHNLFCDMDSDLKEFTDYAIDVITDGIDPFYVDFLLEEEIKSIEGENLKSAEFLRDLRLMKLIIQQIQLGKGEFIQILLNSLDDVRLRSQYMNWAYLNEYDYKLTFEESINITIDEMNKIRESNSIVKKYYDEMLLSAKMNMNKL